jgi:tRNA(Ile)-lysidine synthase
MMLSSLAKRVLEAIERYRMVVPGDRVAVAVSGGGDSVALLLLFEELHEKLGVTLRVIHFNHRLRPGSAEEDERFVGNLAAARGLACEIRSEDVAALAQSEGKNIEEAARERRYAFFRQVVRGRVATRVATGHTADDQAETVLGRICRGSGLRGLGGIQPVLGPVVRPLLDVRRTELRDYLRQRGQPWREDETNLDTSRLRARIRRNLLPAMEADFGAKIVTRLARLAELARRDEAVLDALVESRFAALVRREQSSVEIEAKDLISPWSELLTDDARNGLASRLVQRAAREVTGDLRGLDAKHVERVLELARHGTSGSRLELGKGLEVERVLERVIFTSSGRRRGTATPSRSYLYPADPQIAGVRELVVEIAETAKRVHLKLIDWPAAGRETYKETAGALDAGRLEKPLEVRNWHPGDAYRPLGRGRSEKLKRLLLERRIAARERALWPVLASGGKPVWAGGMPVSAEHAAGPETRLALVVWEEESAIGVKGATRDTERGASASNQVESGLR